MITHTTREIIIRLMMMNSHLADLCQEEYLDCFEQKSWAEDSELVPDCVAADLHVYNVHHLASDSREELAC